MIFTNARQQQNYILLNYMQEYQKFPQPQQIKSTDKKYTTGMNKSRREWKLGVNRIPNKNWRNRGTIHSWQEKKQIKKQKDQLKLQIKQYKQKKKQQRKQNKQRIKQRRRQRQLNEIKSGKFQIVKNNKKVNKLNKKIKKQLVKVPAEVFQSIIAQK